MGKLSVVATPIGNLEDITLRALRTLREADVILCEDTRVTAKLLAKYEISKPLMRADEHVDNFIASKVRQMLDEGKRVALVTDAGTPGISDPGSRIVARVREAGYTIEAIPGPSALTAALSIAGIDADEFLFVGFLPHKKGRQTMLKRIASSDSPVVCYESPHRIEKFLTELNALFPAGWPADRPVSIARELTKVHEEFRTGTPTELLEHLTREKAARGEFVVIIHGSSR